MEHIESLFHDLSRIAPAMEALEKRGNAEVLYDILSGSLFWSDELPKPGGESLECLRFILKYRTGLIIGKPQPEFELFWQEALRRFPKWIGFSLERTMPNDALAGFFLQERKRENGTS